MNVTHTCNCIGPQNGQPRCPCMMRGVIQRDGRWIQPEVDLGPVVKHATSDALDAYVKNLSADVVRGLLAGSSE